MLSSKLKEIWHKACPFSSAGPLPNQYVRVPRSGTQKTGPPASWPKANLLEGVMNRTTRKAGFLLLCLAFGSAYGNETVWCRKFNLGCPTPAEESRKLSNCKMLSNQSYQEALSAALADSTVWRHSGQSSAQEYAEWRKNLMFTLCMRNT